MRLLILLVLWCLLWVFAWPLALLVLIASPIVLLLAIPFGIIGLVLAAMLALAEALFMAPARILGYRSRC
jgi:hypothetical protein